MGNRMLRAALREEERYLERIAALETDLNKLANEHIRLISVVKKLLDDVAGEPFSGSHRGRFSNPNLQALAREIRYFEGRK